MTYSSPLYSLRRAFEVRPMATVFGVAGVQATLPYLPADLYQVDLLGVSMEPCETVATAAVHESGSWSLTFSDGSQFQGTKDGHLSRIL